MNRSGGAALASMAVLLALPGVAPAAGGARPLPAGASQGASVTWGAGSAAPRRVELSRDARADRHDIRLRVRRLKNRSVRLTVPRSARPGTYRVLVCAKRCRPTRSRFSVLPRYGPGHAVNVTPALQGDRAVRQTVGRDGGELTATAADGTRFTLTVPPGALVADTELEMTPVGSARRLPFDRLGGAVQLGPEDAHFLTPATLRIQPPRPPAARRVIPLRWTGAGRDLHLEPATVKGGAITFELFHFSSPGYVLGTNRQYDRLAERSPSARENWARQNLERAIHDKREGGQLSGAGRAAIYVFGNEVARPALEAALQAANPSPDAIGSAIGLELAFERQASLLGLEDTAIDDLQTALRELVKALIDKSERLADERCQAGDPTQALSILAVERVRQLTGLTSDGKDGLASQADAFDAVARCLRFEIVLDSEIAVTTRSPHGLNGGGTFSYHVTSTVPLVADPVLLRTAPAAGPLTFTAYTGERVYSDDCAVERDTPVRAPVDPASMTVAFFALHLYPPRNPDPGVELSLSHSNPEELFHQSDNCNGSAGDDFTENQWADAFRQLHLLEKPATATSTGPPATSSCSRASRGAGASCSRARSTRDPEPAVQLPPQRRGALRGRRAHDRRRSVYRPVPKGTPRGAAAAGSSAASTASCGSTRSRPREPPVRVAEQVHQRGHQHRAQDERVQARPPRRGRCRTSPITRSPLSTKARKTQIMIDGGGVDHPAGLGEADPDRTRVVPGVHPLLVHPADQEHLVVHRQAEQQRQHDHRQERLDRARAAEAQRSRSPSPTGRSRPGRRTTAPAASRFITAAVSGTTRLRKASSSSRKPSPMITADEQRQLADQDRRRSRRRSRSTPPT